MFKSLFIVSCISAMTIFSTVSYAQVDILSVGETNPPATDCVNTLYTVSGTMANTNYGYSGPVVNVVGFMITIEMNYFSGFNPIPGLTPFSEDIDLGLLPVGTYNITVSSTVDGVFSSLLTDNMPVISCCPVSASFTPGDTAVCFPTMVDYTNTSTAATTVSWYIDGIFMNNDQSVGILPTVPGAHTVTLVADDGNCTDSVSYTLTVNMPPVVDLGADTTICFGDSILLDATVPGASYTWFDGSIDSTYFASNAGEYYVYVLDANGCSAIDTIVVDTMICNVSIGDGDVLQKFDVYPNPASSMLTIDGLSGHFQITIYALTGEAVLEEANSAVLDVSFLESGVYIVRASQNGKVYSKTLIIER